MRFDETHLGRRVVYSEYQGHRSGGLEGTVVALAEDGDRLKLEFDHKFLGLIPFKERSWVPGCYCHLIIEGKHG